MVLQDTGFIFRTQGARNIFTFLLSKDDTTEVLVYSKVVVESARVLGAYIDGSSKR